jgi:hypothetical protein
MNLVSLDLSINLDQYPLTLDQRQSKMSGRKKT